MEYKVPRKEVRILLDLTLHKTKKIYTNTTGIQGSNDTNIKNSFIDTQNQKIYKHQKLNQMIAHPVGNHSKEFSRSKTFPGANAPPKRTHWRMMLKLVDLMANH